MVDVLLMTLPGVGVVRTAGHGFAAFSPVVRLDWAGVKFDT